MSCTWWILQCFDRSLVGGGQVHFLHEEDIVDSITQAIQAKLKGSNESRTFAVQPITAMMSFAGQSDNKSKNRANDDSDEEETKREDDSDDDMSVNDTSMDMDTSRDLSRPVEIDLNQKPIPPSRKYQPSQVRHSHRYWGSLLSKWL